MEITQTIGIAPSMKAAASKTGQPKRVIQACKDAGCDAIDQAGRVDCDRLMVFIAEHPEVFESGSSQDRQDKLREKLLGLQAKKIAHQLAVAKKEYIPVIDAQAAIGAMIGEAKKVLLAGPNSLAHQVVGVEIVEAEKLIRDWLNDALSRLSQNPIG